MQTDNVGEISLPKNKLVYQQTKHIDVGHHLIWDYVEYVIVNIQFLHLEENLAENFTNNTSNGTFISLNSGYTHCK